MEATGNFYIDDNVLKEEGVTEFDQYAVEPGLFLNVLLVCLMVIF